MVDDACAICAGIKVCRCGGLEKANAFDRAEMKGVDIRGVVALMGCRRLETWGM